jgi:hypothetical protein
MSLGSKKKEKLKIGTRKYGMVDKSGWGYLVVMHICHVTRFWHSFEVNKFSFLFLRLT